MNHELTDDDLRLLLAEVLLVGKWAASQAPRPAAAIPGPLTPDPCQ